MLWVGLEGGVVDRGDVCRRGRGASSKKGQAGDYSQAWSFRSCDPAGPESLGRSGSRAVFADWVDSAGGEGYGGWAECYLINAVWIVDCRGITGQSGSTWDGRNPMGTWVCRRSRTGLRSTGPPAQVGWSGCLAVCLAIWVGRRNPQPLAAASAPKCSGSGSGIASLRTDTLSAYLCTWVEWQSEWRWRWPLVGLGPPMPCFCPRLLAENLGLSGLPPRGARGVVRLLPGSQPGTPVGRLVVGWLRCRERVCAECLFPVASCHCSCC